MIAGVSVKRQSEHKDPFDVLDAELPEIRAVVKKRLQQRIQEGAQIVGINAFLNASAREIAVEVTSNEQRILTDL